MRIPISGGGIIVIGSDDVEKGVRVVQKGGSDEWGDPVVDKRKAKGDLNLKRSGGAGGVSMDRVDVEDGTEEAGRVTVPVVEGSAHDIIGACAGFELKAGVSKGVNVGVDKFDDVGVVVVHGEESVLGFVVFGRADVEPGVEGGDLGGELAVAIVNSIVGLVEVTAFLVRGVVASDGFAAGNGESFSVALDFLEGKKDGRVGVRGTGTLGATDDVGSSHGGRTDEREQRHGRAVEEKESGTTRTRFKPGRFPCNGGTESYGWLSL